MVIELIRGWSGWKANHIFNSMPDGQANLLIRRGVAREVQDVRPADQQTDTFGGADVRADHAVRSKKAGRSR